MGVWAGAVGTRGWYGGMGWGGRGDIEGCRTPKVQYQGVGSVVVIN